MVPSEKNPFPPPPITPISLQLNSFSPDDPPQTDFSCCLDAFLLCSSCLFPFVVWLRVSRICIYASFSCVMRLLPFSEFRLWRLAYTVPFRPCLPHSSPVHRVVFALVRWISARTLPPFFLAPFLSGDAPRSPQRPLTVFSVTTNRGPPRSVFYFFPPIRFFLQDFFFFPPPNVPPCHPYRLKFSSSPENHVGLPRFFPAHF